MSLVKRKVKKMAMGKMPQTLMKGMASAPESFAVTTRESLKIRSTL
jgi:hypothetical protein